MAHDVEIQGRPVEEYVSWFREQLRQGAKPSSVANQLHSEGIGGIPLILIAKLATGANLGDLKSFGQWLGPDGVTDVEAFDAWAAQIFENEGG